MLNPLLIQLFGREVIERLAEAGFESCATIADAGVERLAEDGGITPILARRIIAVAMEEPREADDLLETAIEPEPAAALGIAVAPETAMAPRTALRNLSSHVASKPNPPSATGVAASQSQYSAIWMADGF